jgi:hypothetical protein
MLRCIPNVEAVARLLAETLQSGLGPASVRAPRRAPVAMPPAPIPASLPAGRSIPFGGAHG